MEYKPLSFKHHNTLQENDHLQCLAEYGNSISEYTDKQFPDYYKAAPLIECEPGILEAWFAKCYGLEENDTWTIGSGEMLKEDVLDEIWTEEEHKKEVDTRYLKPEVKAWSFLLNDFTDEDGVNWTGKTEYPLLEALLAKHEGLDEMDSEENVNIDTTAIKDRIEQLKKELAAKPKKEFKAYDLVKVLANDNDPQWGGDPIPEQHIGQIYLVDLVNITKKYCNVSPTGNTFHWDSLEHVEIPFVPKQGDIVKIKDCGLNLPNNKSIKAYNGHKVVVHESNKTYAYVSFEGGSQYVSILNVHPYVPLTLNQRVEKEIKDNFKLWELAEYFEDLYKEEEYHFKYIRPGIAFGKTDSCIYFNESDSEITVTVPDYPSISFKSKETNYVKAYQKELKKGAPVAPGIIKATKEDLKKEIDAYNDKWKKSNASTNEKHLSVAKKNQKNSATQVVNIKNSIKDGQLLIDNISKLQEMDLKISPTLVTLFNQQNKDIPQYKSQLIEQSSMVKFYGEEVKKHFKKLEKERAASGKDFDKVYDDLQKLCDARILEEVGIDNNGRFYVIYTPLVIQTKYKKCEYLREKNCWCTKDPARYFYMGRVKLEFHRTCAGKCLGIWPIGLSYGNEKYKWYHPHIGPKETCKWWCSNQYQALISQNQGNGNIVGLILLIRQFLTSWNVHSLRVTLDYIKYMEIKNDRMPVGVTDGSFNMKFLEDTFGKFEYGKEVAHAQTGDGMEG